MNLVELKVAIINKQIVRLKSNIRACQYDLQTNKKLKSLQKEKNRLVCVLKVLEKELHTLRAMLKSGKGVYTTLGHTESSLMKRIHILNKEASYYNTCLKDVVEDIDVFLNYDPRKSLEEIAFCEGQIAHYEAMKTKLWEDRELGADEKYVAVASPEEHKALKDALSK